MDLLEIFKAVLWGVVEGVTEWLPISSTGHMILIDELVRLDVTPAFKEMFLVVIQLGAILAVVALYFEKLNPFSRGKSPKQRRETFSLWYKVILACVPAGIVGILFNDYMEENFFNYQTVAVALIVYGVLFIAIENRNKRKRPRIRDLANLDYATALMIGVFQVLSLVPGTSRSGATILGAILIGTSRYVAAEFTFFLAIPVMFGASLLKMMKFGWNYTSNEIAILLTGVISAFVVSILAIKFLMGYIKNNDFKAFGYYRIVLGIIVLAFFFFTGYSAKL